MIWPNDMVGVPMFIESNDAKPSTAPRDLYWIAAYWMVPSFAAPSGALLNESV